jgi:hypothetical protein
MRMVSFETQVVKGGGGGGKNVMITCCLTATINYRI